MSAGFEFAKKHEITICGRAYPCDISDKRMLEGVTRDFPRVLQAAQAFCAMDAKLKPGGQDGRSADTMAQEALKKFSDAVAMCRAFIEGTLGVEEYQRTHQPVRVHLRRGHGRTPGGRGAVPDPGAEGGGYKCIR